MKILDKNDVLLRLVSDAHESESPKSEITVVNTKMKVIVYGVHLELCAHLDNRFLIITSNNCPFEESLNIYLISEKSEILDRVTVAWPYSTGVFEFIGFPNLDCIEFTFFQEKVWRLQVLKKPGLRIPFWSEPAGVWRQFGFRRHFVLSLAPVDKHAHTPRNHVA